jgi:hypothetical protein
LAPLLFALFISPLADITTPTTYADDNYLFGSGETEKKALENCIKYKNKNSQKLNIRTKKSVPQNIRFFLGMKKLDSTK